MARTLSAQEPPEHGRGKGRGENSMVFVTASRQGLKLFLSLAHHEDFPAADTQKDICIWTDLHMD